MTVLRSECSSWCVLCLQVSLDGNPNTPQRNMRVSCRVGIMGGLMWQVFWLYCARQALPLPSILGPPPQVLTGDDLPVPNLNLNAGTYYLTFNLAAREAWASSGGFTGAMQSAAQMPFFHPLVPAPVGMPQFVGQPQVPGVATLSPSRRLAEQRRRGRRQRLPVPDRRRRGHPHHLHRRLQRLLPRRPRRHGGGAARRHRDGGARGALRRAPAGRGALAAPP